MSKRKGLTPQNGISPLWLLRIQPKTQLLTMSTDRLTLFRTLRQQYFEIREA